MFSSSKSLTVNVRDVQKRKKKKSQTLQFVYLVKDLACLFLKVMFSHGCCLGSLSVLALSDGARKQNNGEGYV